MASYAFPAPKFDAELFVARSEALRDQHFFDELAGKRVAMRRDPAVGRSHDFGRACQQRNGKWKLVS